MHTEKADSAAMIDGAATAELVQALSSEIGQWDKWSKQLRRGKRPLALRKLLSANCLFWGLPTDQVIHCGLASRLVGLKKRSSKTDDFDWPTATHDWISAARELNRIQAIEAIAWCHALPFLATRLPRTDWINLLASLTASHQRSTPESTADPLVRFMLATELPLTLAYVLPELEACFSLKDQARRAIGESLDAMLDGEGMPHARHLEFIQLLLASCTRTIVLDEHVKKGRIDRAARLQYDWLSRQTLRWSRPNGTTIFSSDDDSPYFDELVRATFELTNDESDALAHMALRGKRKSARDQDLPACSEHSEWSELATLRTSWSPNAARLAVSFPRDRLGVEIGVENRTLISGDCMPSVLVDGDQLEPSSEWDEVCWESDKDMDYVELECTMQNDWRVQRQFLLARDDRFAFIADAVLGPTTATIQYKHTLPLVSGITLEQSGDTNEGTVKNSKHLSTIIPLSLPEWQIESRNERLRPDPARLEIERRGRALYAPLFVDLDPTRLSKALTWRRLTVGENLQPLTAESAVAFRLQIGKQQWVFYRSLDKPANRTFLGLNIVSEFLAARFNSDGETESLIDIAG